MSDNAAQTHSGGCHCGNIHLTFESAIDPADASRAAERAELAEKMNAIYAAVREPLDPSWGVVLGRNDGSAPCSSA